MLNVQFPTYRHLSWLGLVSSFRRRWAVCLGEAPLYAIRSRRVFLTLFMALVVAMPTAMFIAPPAWAVPAAPVLSATGAPDGVYVFWGPDNLVSHKYRLMETVDGVTTQRDVWGASYADTALLPGQEATYSVVAVEVGGESAESAPVTAARLAQDWAEPQGARTESLAGEVDTDVGDTPFTNSSPTLSLDADGRTRLRDGGMAFARLSGPGTFELAIDPTSGQVGFSASCRDLRGADSGSVVVHDLVYGASGMPLELGADFTWHCVGGMSYHLTLRFHSPAPMAHVVLEPPTGDFVVQGSPALTTWHLRNLGDAPATIGAIAASSGKVVDNPCTGIVLDGLAECTISMDMSEPVSSIPGGRVLTLSARVADQPGAAILHGYAVYLPLQAAALAIGARLPDRVLMTWGPFPDGTQPLRALKIERQPAPGVPWVTVAQPPATDGGWVDRDVIPGMDPSYRITVLAQDGSASDPSEPLSVTVPSAGLVWPGGQVVSGGSRPEDPVSVSVLSWPSFPGNSTGVDVSPDRNHLAVTTYTDGTNTNRLLLTDLSGASIQVLDTNNNGNAGFNRPFFSPDGKKIAYVSGHGWSGAISVLDIATKTRKDVLNQGILYGWSPDGTKVLLADGINKYGDPLTGLRWVNLADDSYTAIAGTSSFPNEDATYRQSADVSRSGQIAWVSHAAAGDTLMRTGPAAGSPTTLWAPSGCVLGEPRFDPTGAVLSIGIGGGGCSAGAGGTVTLSVPATGTASVLSQMLRFAPQGPQWLQLSSVAPNVTLAVPAVSSATATATITTSDADDAVGGLTRACRLDAGAWQTCAATFTMTKLAAGRHTLTARATDPSAHASADAQTSWTVDTTPPTTSLAAVSNPLLGSSLTLHWKSTDAGGSSVASYDIRDRYARSDGGFGAFNYPSTWQRRTSPSLTVGLSQGSTYCFSVRTRDRVGNVGSWSSERCTMVAYDDRALAVSGPYRGTSSAAMYGTYTRTFAAGQTLSRTRISARRVGVVAAVCSTCGAVDVWLGGVKIGTVNTSRSTTKWRQVLWLPIQTTTRTGTVVLRSSSSRRVYVDGIVFQK